MKGNFGKAMLILILPLICINSPVLLYEDSTMKSIKNSNILNENFAIFFFSQHDHEQNLEIVFL